MLQVWQGGGAPSAPKYGLASFAWLRIWNVSFKKLDWRL
jgi:hypothetical protein